MLPALELALELREANGVPLDSTSTPDPREVDVVPMGCKFASQHRSVMNIEQQIDLAPDLPPVYADGKQMQQVFLNLILNAFQAMPGGGKLKIATSRTFRNEQEYVRIDVADSGPGIPSQILEKIFTPFFTTKAQGTGLGLPICCKLIHLHNGDIRVTSDDTQGTVFTIELPACNTDDIDAMRSEHETQQDSGC